MKEKIIITGLGRCGTSLLMQILDAAGFPVSGEYPAYEDGQCSDNLLFAPEGKASKVIDLHRSIVPKSKYKWIWLKRNYEQQAKSIAKFLYFVTRTKMPDSIIPSLIESLIKDELECKRIILNNSGDFLEINFEDFFTKPELILKSISDFLDFPDINRCKNVIIKRNSDCLPDLLEIQLIENAKTTKTPNNQLPV